LTITAIVLYYGYVGHVQIFAAAESEKATSKNCFEAVFEQILRRARKELKLSLCGLTKRMTQLYTKSEAVCQKASE
jgi:hypothetical protein